MMHFMYAYEGRKHAIDPYYNNYEYQVTWGIDQHANDMPDGALMHIITLPGGQKEKINFDPKAWMSRRDFVRLIDYYEATGKWPVNILPDEPLQRGTPSLFCAIAGVP